MIALKIDLREDWPDGGVSGIVIDFLLKGGAIYISGAVTSGRFESCSFLSNTAVSNSWIYRDAIKRLMLISLRRYTFHIFVLTLYPCKRLIAHVDNLLLHCSPRWSCVLSMM